MIYIFDSNTLIKIFDNYYPSQFPSFWDKFNECINDGSIISVRAVKTELKDRGDSLSDFVKDTNIFANPENNETEFIAQIFSIKHFQDLISRKSRLLGKEVADPYLIAKAKTMNACVVTEEKLKTNAAKIPNVCQKFNICCMNLEKFMEQESWSF